MEGAEIAGGDAAHRGVEQREQHRMADLMGDDIEIEGEGCGAAVIAAIDAELQEGVTGALETIVARGDAVRRVVPTDASRAIAELGTLVNDSRRALANARRVVAGYRGSSVRAELDAAAALLEASGATVQIAIADGARKIGRARCSATIVVTRGQLMHEWDHLLAKLAVRDPALRDRLEGVTRPHPHPLFRVVAGDVGAREKGSRLGNRRR